MNNINEKEAFSMGEKAYLDGLPESAYWNQIFWQEANKINGHTAWKIIMNSYVEGWRNAEKKAPK